MAMADYTYRPEMALGPAAMPSVKLVDSAAAAAAAAGEHWRLPLCRECGGPAVAGERPGYRKDRADDDRQGRIG